MADLNLYPLPSGVSVASSVTVRLNDSNYLLWKPQLEALLFSQKLIGFVTGREAQPPLTVAVAAGNIMNQVPNPRREAWDYTDQLVKSWLYSTLSEEVLGCVVGFKTSREIWSYLEENYNRRTIGRVFELRRALQLLTKKEKSLSEYCRSFRLICDQLSSIGEPVDETMKIFNFLNGLGREYDPVNTVIQNSLTRFPTPTFNDVVAEVSGYDARLKSYEDVSEVSPHLAFQVSRGGYNSNRGRGGNTSRGRGDSGYSSRGRGFTQQVNSQSDLTQQVNSFSQSTRPTCQICGRYGHSALKCYNRFDSNYQEEAPQAFAAIHVSNSSGDEWLPDSGASAHIKNNLTGLENVKAFNGSENIIVADGNKLPITHVGSTSLAYSSGSLPLNDVLVCPSIQHSLLSISKLCEDYPCGVYFDNDKVLVLDKETSKIMARGNKRNGLYVLHDSEFTALYSNRQSTVSPTLWHNRLGHANFQVIQQLLQSKSISANKKLSHPLICEACQMGKSSSLPYLISDSRSLEPLSLIHCDLWGPSPITSFQGFKYYAVFVDDFTRYSWIFPMKLKSDFLGIFTQFQTLVENQFSKKIKSFQSDGGGEFTNKSFLKHLANNGIKHQLSCPHTPQQNGFVERRHRHLVELGLSMLFHSQVPLHYWVEAFFTANHIINILPSQILDKKSPHELLLQEIPEYHHLRVFGCAVYPCLRPYAVHKLEPRSLLCVFLGYNNKYKGYRCLYPPTGRVFITRNAIFDEELFPFKDQYKELIPKYTSTLLQSWQERYPSPISILVPAQDPIVFNKPATLPLLEDEQDYSDGSTGSLSYEISSSDSSAASPSSSDSSSSPPESENVSSGSSAASPSSDSSSSPPVPENAHPMQTRAKSGITKPNPRYILFSDLKNVHEPETVEEALQDQGWTQACLEELDSLYVTETYDLVPPTQDMNILGCRWVFKTKLKSDGNLDRLKARLVAKGFQQAEGVDFLETYSPVVRTATIRIVLSIAVSKGWSITQLDVKNAFLHGELSEPVFMEQPPGFISSETPSYVCRLKKAIYGLKQAPRAWFDRFSNYILDLGFQCSKADPSLFTYHHSGDTIALLLYVDDIILTGSNNDQIKLLVDKLSNEFMMKDLGALHYFLGVQADFHERGLFLHQSKYAEEILHLSGMSDCNSMATPLPLPTSAKSRDSEPFEDATYFRKLAGKLQYLTITRPDLQYAVNLVCQRMHKPTNADFANLKRVLRYLKGTSQFGLHISNQSSLNLHAFSDSDWAGCRETRRSTTGFCIFLGTNLLSWCAKRQPTVSRSSTEAEYRAMASAAAELTWISHILRDIGVKQNHPPTLRCDNLSAVHLTINPILHSRSKHMEIDYHYVREQVALGLLETRHVSAINQTADIFTKALSRQPFTDLRFKLNVGILPP